MATELLRECFPIQGRDFEKAGEVSSGLKVLLRDLGIDPAVLRRLVIIAFEAEMNVVMYADRGLLTVVLTDEHVRLTIGDEGPGIPDIELAMREGYSTASDEMREMGFGFGMGLPNMKKNADEFGIESDVGRGTKVSALIRLNSHGRAETRV
jgi:anti-sigma regulatory factor (Ser/Thr protein kinase)